MLTRILCFILISRLGATSLLPLDIEGLISRSNSIIHAKPIDAEPFYHKGHLWTRWSVKVLDYAKGSGPSRLSLIQPGGKKGRQRTLSSGTANLQPGEEYCLFLWSDPTGAHQILGFTQGSMKIIRDFLNEPILAVSGTSSEVIARSMQKLSGDRSSKERVLATFTVRPSWKHLKALIKEYE